MALWNLDLAFADVVSTSSDARLGAIRLAWWRERLEELDKAGDPPAEPRLQAVARELLPRGITGGELSQLEDAWLPLLEPFPWGDGQADALKLRGRILFGIAARLLGGQPQDAEPAGELWSLIDGARHCSDAGSRDRLFEAARQVAVDRRIPAKLRSLTILAALAVVAVTDPASGLARGMAAAHHRVTGRIVGL
jgi:phytoene synthase